jgi:hypothetical protein
MDKHLWNHVRDVQSIKKETNWDNVKLSHAKMMKSMSEMVISKENA